MAGNNRESASQQGCCQGGTGVGVGIASGLETAGGHPCHLQPITLTPGLPACLLAGVTPLLSKVHLPLPEAASLFSPEPPHPRAFRLSVFGFLCIWVSVSPSVFSPAFRLSPCPFCSLRICPFLAWNHHCPPSLAASLGLWPLEATAWPVGVPHLSPLSPRHGFPPETILVGKSQQLA